MQKKKKLPLYKQFGYVEGMANIADILGMSTRKLHYLQAEMREGGLLLQRVKRVDCVDGKRRWTRINYSFMNLLQVYLMRKNMSHKTTEKMRREGWVNRKRNIKSS